MSRLSRFSSIFALRPRWGATLNLRTQLTQLTPTNHHHHHHHPPPPPPPPPPPQSQLDQLGSTGSTGTAHLPLRHCTRFSVQPWSLEPSRPRRCGHTSPGDAAFEVRRSPVRRFFFSASEGEGDVGENSMGFPTWGDLTYIHIYIYIYLRSELEGRTGGFLGVLVLVFKGGLRSFAVQCLG